MDKNPRSLKLISMKSTTDRNYVRPRFKISSEDIKKMRQKVVSQLDNKQDTNEANSKHFSTFVISYAYVSTIMIKAKGLEKNIKLIIGFPSDIRARLDPGVPENYIGNCVIPNMVLTEVEVVNKEDGLGFVAEELRKVIKGLEKKGCVDEARKTLATFMTMDPATTEALGVAGSPRFEVYSIDFGWGKPMNVEVTSIDRGTSISMAETRDGIGGVEIGVVLKKDEMNIFHSLFLNDLKHL